MQFGPHAPFSDPLNLAFASNRVNWLKAVVATGLATQAHVDELATLKARIADHYAAHVAAYVNRVLGVEPYTQDSLDAVVARETDEVSL